MEDKLSLSDNNTLNFEHYIPAKITILSNKLSSGSSTCYRKNFNVGVMEWRILAVLKVVQNTSANKISYHIGLDKSAVSRTLKQLEKNELVNFTKDKSDARSTLIKLSKKGEMLHDQMIKIALKREELFLDGITKEEKATFLKILHKMSNNIDKTNNYDPSVELI